MSLEMILYNGKDVRVIGDHSPKNEEMFDFAINFLVEKYKETLGHDNFQLPLQLRQDTEDFLNMLAGPFTCHFYDLSKVSKEKFVAFAENTRRLPKDSKFVVSHFYDGIHEDKYGVILLMAPGGLTKRSKIPMDKESIEKSFKENKCVVSDCTASPSDLIRFYDGGSYALDPGTKPELTVMTCEKHNENAVNQYALSSDASLIYIVTQDSARTAFPDYAVMCRKEGIGLIHIIASRKIKCGYEQCEEVPVKSMAAFDGEEALIKDMTSPVVSVCGCEKHVSKRWHEAFSNAHFESDSLVIMVQDFREFKPPQMYLAQRK